MHGRSRVCTPTRLDSLLFVALMSGPPKFRERDVTASLVGSVDIIVLVQIAVWLAAGLWVLVRLYPYVRRGALPAPSGPQALGLLLIGALSLSVTRSPGVLLTAFMLGQFAVMLAFAWLFVLRYGPTSYLRHVFACVCALALLMVTATVVAPNLVFVGERLRFRGDLIAPTAPVAAMGLVFCLSGLPQLRLALFWPALAFFGVLLAWGQTRTAFIAFLVYLAIGFVYGRGLPVRRLVPLLGAVALGLLAFEAHQSTTEYLVRDTQSLQTMSDRLPLWAHLTKAVMRDDAMMGMGYYAASRILAPQYNWALGNAHSAFMEIFVGGGVIALTVYLLLCASLVVSAARLLSLSAGHPEAVAAAGLLVVGLVQAVTTSEALNAGPIGFGFWSMTALLPALRREAAARVVPLRARLRMRTPPAAAPVAATPSAVS